MNDILNRDIPLLKVVWHPESFALCLLASKQNCTKHLDTRKQIERSFFNYSGINICLYMFHQITNK